MTTTWTIEQCEHDVATGGITVAHWRATDIDGACMASAYGTVGFQPDPDAPGFKPYANVTEADVLAWVWDRLDKAQIEEALASQVAMLANPVSAVGLPWAAKA
jgi:hypothetical protein